MPVRTVLQQKGERKHEETEKSRESERSILPKGKAPRARNEDKQKQEKRQSSSSAHCWREKEKIHFDGDDNDRAEKLEAAEKGHTTESAFERWEEILPPKAHPGRK